MSLRSVIKRLGLLLQKGLGLLSTQIPTIVKISRFNGIAPKSRNELVGFFYYYEFKFLPSETDRNFLCV